MGGPARRFPGWPVPAAPPRSSSPARLAYLRCRLCAPPAGPLPLVLRVALGLRPRPPFDTLVHFRPGNVPHPPAAPWARALWSRRRQEATLAAALDARAGAR